jgi:putative SOS response-associated peptidase YedK
MKPIHQRMPVILPKEQREEWLNSANHDTKTLLDLLNPYPAGEMEAYPVSHFVNSPGNNTPECIKPLTGS